MPTARKPDNVHLLNGTYQKHRHGDLATKPKWDVSLPDMPDCLCDEAKVEWDRIIDLVPNGVLTKTDRALLTQYCTLWAELEKDPAEFPSSKHSQFKLVQQELGFTPVSRDKIGGAPKDHSKDGPQPIPR